MLIGELNKFRHVHVQGYLHICIHRFEPVAKTIYFVLLLSQLFISTSMSKPSPASKKRSTQPRTVTAEQIRDALKVCVPMAALITAKQDGILFHFEGTDKKRLVDKINMKLWEKLLHCLLDINPNGVYNPTFLCEGLKLWNQDNDGVLTNASFKVMLNEVYDGQHLQNQAYVLKRYLMGLGSIRRNTATGTRAEPWLKSLLGKLIGTGDGLDISPHTGIHEIEAPEKVNEPIVEQDRR